jgi:pimeloyl-ACP methyl ester carboxylesterase
VQPSLVLIPSPLLGPATWMPVASVLQRRGHDVRVADLRRVAQSAPPYWPCGVEAIVESAGDGPVLLVPHSNSGLYVPAVLEALGDQVRGVVFVDAALPQTGYYAQRAFLNTLVEADGRLPPWTSWWDEADVAELFPDAEVRARVEAEQQRMPLAYWEHPPPAPDGWDTVACSYLWFAEPYDSGAEQAAARNWPTRRAPGQHLHMLVDPETVATAVLELGQHAQRQKG